MATCSNGPINGAEMLADIAENLGFHVTRRDNAEYGFAYGAGFTAADDGWSVSVIWHEYSYSQGSTFPGRGAGCANPRNVEIMISGRRGVEIEGFVPLARVVRILKSRAAYNRSMARA